MGEDYKSFATKVLDNHPELRAAMIRSPSFERLKQKAFLDEVKGEKIYLVNDTQGSEDDLYVDALVKGFKGLVKRKLMEGKDAIYRDLFLELDDRLQAIVEKELSGPSI
jgi:hypothetical protein